MNKNTDNNKKKLVIAFSGGATSACMADFLVKNRANDYSEIVVVFCNTGQEHPKTLDFVNNCDRLFNLNVVWLEAKVFHGKRKGTGHNIVDFESASREGEPFEQVIIKYGIPNKSYLHCTRELKLSPIKSYLRSLGWKKGDYYTAIGIRSDEMNRVSSKMNEEMIIYPLCEDKRMSKGDVRDFWLKQPFQLGIDEHEGNCVFCHKKSLRKLMTLAIDRPETFDFPIRMEKLYRLNGSEDGRNGGRVFFRKNTSGLELIEKAKNTDFKRFTQDQVNWGGSYVSDLDDANGCSESCEVY